jgi:hypothetical protein
MDVCGWEGAPLHPPEGASNQQPVLPHSGIVSAHNWLTGESLCESLCVCDTNALAEELEPLWFTTGLFRVQEACGYCE